MGKTFALALALVFLFAATFVFAGGAAAGPRMPDVDITFDGSSDGLALSTDGGEFVNGTHCGIDDDAVWGTKFNEVIHLTNDPDGSYANLHTMVGMSGWWAVYSPAGLVDNGTWSAGCPIVADIPSRAAAAPAAAGKADASFDPMARVEGFDKALLGPDGVIEVSFDGFCDGMSLTVTGSFADGQRCGCATEPVFGTKGYKGAHVSPEAGTRRDRAHFVVRYDGTFGIYTNAGLFYNGTWSAGCPVLENVEGLPASTSQ